MYYTKKEVCLGTTKQNRKIASFYITFIVCAIFVFFFAARWYVGTDYGNYYYFFSQSVKWDYTEILKMNDYGYYLLNAFVSKNITTNYFIFSLIVGALIYLPIIFTYRKYTNDFFATCSLCVMMGIYTWPFNGIRQAIAASFLFAAFPLLYTKRNLLKYALVVFVAFAFHSSVLLVIPFVLITRLKPWGRRFITICLIIAIFIYFLPNIWKEIIELLEILGQTKMATDYSSLEDMRSGVNLFRIMVLAAPIVVSYFYYDKLKSLNPHIDILINMSILAFMFTVCGLRATVLVRFNAFFNLANPILVAEFSNIFDKRSKKIGMLLIFVLYFIHMIILLPTDSDLVPYKFIFGQLKT